MKAPMSELKTPVYKKNKINTVFQNNKLNGNTNLIMPSLNTSSIQVQKRDGRKELLDINKIHFVVEEACDGLAGVSASQIEMNATLSACRKRKIPVTSFKMKDLTPESISSMIIILEITTILLAKKLNINPFNQPSVELIKKNIRD